jgi:hypothetical protein
MREVNSDVILIREGEVLFRRLSRENRVLLTDTAAVEKSLVA